jgi:hypothetical protein
VQNQSAALQELIPAAPGRALRPQKEPRNP